MLILSGQHRVKAKFLITFSNPLWSRLSEISSTCHNLMVTNQVQKMKS